jgi:hypothetical protein
MGVALRLFVKGAFGSRGRALAAGAACVGSLRSGQELKTGEGVFQKQPLEKTAFDTNLEKPCRGTKFGG